MDIAHKIMEEIKYLRQADGIKVATVGSTARLLAPFLILPRRSYHDFSCINFLVSRPEDAALCLERLDGEADYVLVDVEAKQPLDLMAIAASVVRRSALAAYKPNDASVEAADLLVRHHFQDQLGGKSILILGAGNLSSKLALRLCERNANIQMHSRNFARASQIADGLNAMLPGYTSSRVEAIETLPLEENRYDALVSFIAADQIADEGAARLVRPEGLAVDGGINNFSPGFLLLSQQRGVGCCRLDVRLGFLYALLAIQQDVSHFHSHVKGERLVGDIRLLAGGMIGRRGDVIVDRIDQPGQIIGIANGIGSILPEIQYTETDRQKLNKIEEMLKRGEL